MPQSIQGKIARGASWMLAFRLVDRALAFLSTIILARVLVPADFGLVAMAMSVITLVELFSAFSLEVGLIQRSNPERGHFDSTWTLRLLFAIAVAIATAALALSAAHFYGDPRIAPVLLVLAANILIGGFENIGVVNFRRELDFRREFVFMISRRLAAMPVTLTLAILFSTYWALVIGVVFGTLVAVALSYRMSPYRPRFALEKWRELMSFSLWLFGFNLLAFLQQRLSHFLLGRTHGAGVLGIYTVATDIAALASSEITAPINRAVMPGLSRLAEQADGMQSGLLRVTSAALLITMPAGAGMAAVAEPLVLTLLGGRWLDAVPILQTLALTGALQSVTANNHSAYLASARVHVPVVIVGSYVAILVPLMFAMLELGALGIALAHLAATLVTVVVSVGMMRRYIGTTVAALLNVIWRPFVAAAVMGAAVYWLDTHVAATEWPAILRLSCGVLVGIALYIPLVLLLWRLSDRRSGIEQLLADRLRQVLRRGSKESSDGKADRQA